MQPVRFLFYTLYGCIQMLYKKVGQNNHENIDSKKQIPDKRNAASK